MREIAATPQTLYACRPVLNADDIHAWAEEQGFKSVVPEGDLHVTVAFSREPVVWNDLPQTDAEIEVEDGEGEREIKPLGDKGAIVLKFESDALQDRWQEFRDHGCSWDYPSYQSHITITYDGKGVDVSKMTPYDGPIILGPEKFAKLDKTWSDRIEEVALDEDMFSTRNTAFARWFAGSKVVNQRGEPLRVYHGTDAHFSAFMRDSHFGTYRAANARVNNRFGKQKVGQHIIPVYLRITNPLRVTDAEASNEHMLLNAIVRGKYPDLDPVIARKEGAYEAARRAGYDGLVYNNRYEDRGRDSWVIFDPTQAKSAVGNKKFDAASPDLMENPTVISRLIPREDDALGIFSDLKPFQTSQKAPGMPGHVATPVLGIVFKEFTHDGVEYQVFADRSEWPPTGYILLQRTGGWWQVLEAHVAPSARRTGLFSRLLQAAVHRNKKIALDQGMSANAIGAVEKLVRDKQVNASFLDVRSGVETPYSPHLGLYDKPVQGISRPSISPDDAANIVWVLHEGHRSEVLMPYGYVDDKLREMVSHQASRMVAEGFRLDDFEDVETLYRIFADSYQKETGTAWSKDKFLSRARGWVFYGDETGYVAVRPQRSGMKKLVAVAGDPRGVLRGLDDLAAEGGPIWGAVSAPLAKMAKKRGMIVPHLIMGGPTVLKALVRTIPPEVFGGVTPTVEPDGGVALDYPDTGRAVKYLIGNREYFKQALGIQQVRDALVSIPGVGMVLKMMGVG